MFARGDVVELNLKRTDGLREVGILKDADHLISAHDGKVQSTAGYEMTKPPFLVPDIPGRRFVPSGEYRVPCQGEYWSHHKGTDRYSVYGPGIHALGESDNNGYRPILLPVPELEPTPEPVPEPEFKVDDWIFINGIGPYRIQSVEDNAYCWIHHGNKTKGITRFEYPEWDEHKQPVFTKAPGRPLTTDDLMQVLSGKKVKVECHACGCGGIRDTLKAEMFANGLFFFYEHNGENIGEIKDGSIVFADGVEGNIYIVGEA